MTTNTTADTLRKAKALISDPVNWNQDGSYIRGEPLGEETGEGTCMCVYGAVMVAHGISNPWYSRSLLKDALEEAALEVNQGSVHEYNDSTSTTHEDIMELFDRAIELAEEQESGNT